MVLKTIEQTEELKEICANGIGSIWAQDEVGKTYDMRDRLMCSIVLDMMKSENDILLFASRREDEFALVQFMFSNNIQHAA